MSSLPVPGHGRLMLILVVLAALSAIGPFSVDLYTPSLPEMEADLGVADWLAQATITGCLLGIGVGQFLWGPLSDRFGRRPVILVGVAGWAITSGASALAMDPTTLVALRVLAGLFGAACIVAARSVVRDLTPDPRVRAARIGMLSMVSAAAPIVAPLGGAAVAQLWGWRADFVLLGIIGLVLAIGVALAVPESLAPAARTREGLGIVSGLSAALRDRETLGIALSIAAFTFGFYAYVATASFIVEREHHYPAFAFALVFGTNAVAMVGANLVFRRLVRRHPPRSLLLVGLVAGALAGLLLLLSALGQGPDWLLWAASTLFAMSAGFVLPGGHAAGQATLVASGAASALTGAAQFLGGVLGSPLTGAIGATAAVLGAILAICAALGAGIWWTMVRPAARHSS